MTATIGWRQFRLLRPRRPGVFLMLAACLVAISCATGNAQQGEDRESSAAGEGGEAQQEKPTSTPLDQMRHLADRIAVSRRKGDDKVDVRRIEKPFWRYNDRQRGLQDATVWAFGTRGRPAAFVTVEKYEEFLSLEFASSSEGIVAASVLDQWTWAPTKLGVVLRPVSKAPDPAKDEEGRLTQMKAIAGRFQVRETTHNEATFIIPLRRDPVYRYSDPERGIVDGGMFIYVHGKNPEVMLALECVKKEEDARWQFCLIPMTSLRLSATLDKAEVWTHDFATAPWQQDLYTFGRVDQIPKRAER